MKFLKCVVSSPSNERGNVEFIALDKILTISPRANGEEITVLIGAGMYYHVFRDSPEIVEISMTDDIKNMYWEV